MLHRWEACGACRQTDCLLALWGFTCSSLSASVASLPQDPGREFASFQVTKLPYPPNSTDEPLISFGRKDGSLTVTPSPTQCTAIMPQARPVNTAVNSRLSPSLVWPGVLAQGYL